MKTNGAFLLLAAPFALLAGCVGGAPPSSATGGGGDASSVTPITTGGGDDGGAVVIADPSSLTYYKDTQPILAKNCMPCHAQGGAGTPAFDDATSAAAVGASIKAAVNAGTMPPFPPADGCNKYIDELRLDPTEKATLLAWVDAGAAAGDPATATAIAMPAADGLPANPDKQLVAPSFTPTYPGSAGPDDLYWCFPLNPGLSVSTDLVAAKIIPGNSSEVHHVIISRDVGGKGTAGKPATGFECNGVPGDMVYAWVPGARPMQLPEGVGMTLDPSDRLYMQVHYHRSLSIAPGPDQTVTNLYFASATQAEHAYVVWTGTPLFSIPAGATNYKVNATCTVNGDWRVIGIAPHMHKLGTAINLDATVAAAPQCLMNIPKWDFNWQGGYGLQQGLTMKAGDKISTSCTFNNTTGAKVSFGESTGDEMCFGFVTIVAAQKPVFNNLITSLSGLSGLCPQ